jgi:atrazine chlorohydrolase/5-methylthioadenosine/S-adenosylhomocysteine deaminase/melamine deaminase
MTDSDAIPPDATPSLLVVNGHLLTMDGARQEFAPGYVAAAGDRIIAVGPQSECPYQTAERVVDAAGKAVLPGFVNAHTHAIHILMRGGLSDDRSLYDWLFNVILPGLAVYTDDDVALAAEFYCHEALRAGITTFVDNVEFPVGRFDDAAEAALGVYRDSGQRVVYARMFYDYTPPGFDLLVAAVEAREPEVRHDPGGFESTEAALASIDLLMRRHHRSGEGRIQVWPSPGVAIFCTPEGLLGARDLARAHGARVTLHLSESEHDRMQAGMTSIEYLASIGFLGPDVLAGHCTQASASDLRILRDHDVKVANNVVSNLFLGSGIAPVPEMLDVGITVGLGTDDANCNNSVNLLADMKTAGLAQKGRTQRADVMTAEKALEMATIDGARALGMEADIGSLEVGKKADLAVVDLSHPRMRPLHNVASALVYQASGAEVDTVVVDGRVLLEDGELALGGAARAAEVAGRVQETSERVARDARLTGIRRGPRRGAG